ncbi:MULTISPECIES: hypothetical protein [unclassified Microcoleus]|uniref:hypothetical protein n=1 Tax=unclassified Microcoleus TaxID=2642155 RepID=UPI002FD38E38
MTLPKKRVQVSDASDRWSIPKFETPVPARVIPVSKSQIEKWKNGKSTDCLMSEADRSFRVQEPIAIGQRQQLWNVR